MHLLLTILPQIYICVYEVHKTRMDKTINTDVMARRHYPNQCFQSHTVPYNVAINNKLMESILDTNIFVLYYVM